MLPEKSRELPTYNVIKSLDENNQLLDEQNVRELTLSLLMLAVGQRLEELMSTGCGTFYPGHGKQFTREKFSKIFEKKR